MGKPRTRRLSGIVRKTRIHRMIRTRRMMERAARRVPKGIIVMEKDQSQMLVRSQSASVQRRRIEVAMLNYM
jgi:hypothetical protein